MGWAPVVHEMVPVDHASVQSSRLVVGVTVVLPLLLALACGAMYWRAARRARLAAASYGGDHPLAPGEVVLRGRVAYARGESTAVRVEIEQRGSERRGKKTWQQSWVEASRQITVRPFYLEADPGLRIRVEPADDVCLVDDLDATFLRARDRRTRMGELGSGEVIYARGTLVAATDPEQPANHRGGTAGALVLRRPAGGRMLLSSRPLSEPFERRARSLRRWLVAYLVVFGMSLHLNLSYFTIALVGERAVGTVTAKDHGVSGSAKSTFRWWRITIATPAGWAFPAYLDRSDWAAVDRGDHIAIIYIPTSPGAYTDLPDLTGARVGTGPAQYVAVGVGVVAVSLCMLMLQIVWWRQGRPWYEGKLEETDPGRLREA